MTGEIRERPDVAYVYPPPFWGGDDSAWVKSLLLFFDQLAILLPSYMHGLHVAADPSTVIPLEERGLLRVLEPNDWIDEEMAESLTEVMVGLLTNGAFEGLPTDVQFHELSQSRIGYGGDVGLAEMLVDELEAKGLARPSEDGVSIPLHPRVRTTILVMLGQLSRVAGARRNLNVHPATRDRQAIIALAETLSSDPMPSAHNVITLDLEPVGFDLASVPLDDILEFREEHGPAHLAYVRNLREFMAQLADIDDADDRERVLIERRQAIADAAHELQRSTRRSLGKNLPSISCGLAGAAWSIIGGDPLGLALAAGGLISQALSGCSAPVTAYSYIFEVNRQFGGYANH